MLEAEMREAIAAAAKELQIEPAALAALVEIESAGRTQAMIAGKAEPLIRFEGHYFDRRLTGDKRERARRDGLSSPQVGAIKNPRSQAARWDILRRAAAIDRIAAYESTSWGVGQVMGAHWAWLGYGSVDALVTDARDGLSAQLRLMVRYITKAGLSDALRKHDWAAVARGYNGPGYRRNRYDAKLKQAFARYADADFATQPRGAETPRTKARRSVWLFDDTVRFFANLFGRGTAR